MTIYMNIIDMYWHAIWKRLVSDAIAEEIFTEDGNTNTINHLVWFHEYFPHIFGFLDCIDVRTC